MSLTHARLAIGGVVLKHYGAAWQVGTSKPCVLSGRPSEAIDRPSYSLTLPSAFAFFVGRVEHARRATGLPDADAELMDWLAGAPIRSALEVLGAQSYWVRMRQSELGLSTRALARLAGVDPHTVRRIRDGGSVTTRSLCKVLEAIA